MLQIAGKQCAQEQVGAWFQFIVETSLLFARTWQEGIQSADLQSISVAGWPVARATWKEFANQAMEVKAL